MHTIFYFSGTGNCLQVAKMLAERFDEEVELIRVCYNTDVKGRVFSGKIGIVYPIYSNFMPPMLKDFLEELEVEPGENTCVYTVLTHGGMIGRVHVYLKSIFRRKGVQVMEEFAIRMPHNSITQFDAEPEAKQKIWFSGLDSMIQQIVDIVNEGDIIELGQAHPGMKARMKMGLDEKMKDLAKVMAKPSDEQEFPNPFFVPAEREAQFYADDKCTGCGICSRVCPADNIRIQDGKPVWQGHCENCMACLQWCPQEALQCGEITLERRRYHNPNVSLQDMIISRQ